jgi:RHS repeat-associated protein
VVTCTPDSAGRTLLAIDSGNGINYVTSATYGPDSALTGSVSGNSGTFAGITNAFSYNKRLQPLAMSAAAPSQTVFSIGYDFHLGNGDNGNVFGITNYKDQNRNQTFTYDALNRLISAQNAGTNCGATLIGGKSEYWGNSYGYDAWGNLLQKSVTKCGAENLVVTADAHNWLHASGTDYQYDAAGNMTYDATARLSYNFDQENRLTGAAGYAYTYDGDGNRVRKSNSSTGTLYWYMTPGIVGESDLSGNLTDEYVFFGGERVARKSTNGVFYYFSDHLKTASVITDSAGVIKAESDYYPWGGELQFVANDSNHYKFTGKERDAESGLDNFGARMYGNALGRFVTPDPLLNSGRPWDPQTWNRYAYAHNNPLTYVDPSGLYDWQANAGGSATDDELRKKSGDKDVSRKDRNAAKDALKFRDKFRAALAAASGVATGSDQGALAAYGSEGDHNGVNVGTQLGYGAGTILNKDDSISVNFGKDVSGNDLAVTVAHEGQHVEDGQQWVSAGHPLGTMFDMNHYERETRAWGVSARIAQGLGMSHFGPHGGGSEYYVWNSSWHNVDHVNTAIGNIVRDLYHQMPGDTDRYSKENPGDVPKYGPGCDCH